MPISQQNGDFNLTSAPEIYNQSAADDGEYDFVIDIGDGTKDLDTDASVISIQITNGDQVLNGGWENHDKDSGLDRVQIRTRERFGPIYVVAGDSLVIDVESTDPDDTDVDITITPIEISKRHGSTRIL